VRASRTVALLVPLLATPCFAHHMAVVVSPQNSVENLTSAQLGRIMRAETGKWPDGRDILLILHRSSAGETTTLQRLNKMSSSRWQQWVNEHKSQIIFADSDEEVLNVVGRTAGAIGLVELHSVNPHVKVVHVDGKLPLESGYLPH
jgi:ABC-type phosphate transport system substrate-binding protein